MTPQQLSRKDLTERGYLVGLLESRKQFPDRNKTTCRTCGKQPMISISVDLFNCFDLAGFHPETGQIILVQVTSASNHSTRRNKILASMEAKLCLLSNAKILVQSWSKQNNRWVVRDEWIRLIDFKQAPNYPNTVRELLEIKRKEKMDDLPPSSTLPLMRIKDEEIPF